MTFKEDIIKPRVFIPIFSGAIITIFIYSMLLTTWVYTDLSSQYNKDTDMEWTLYILDTRVTALEVDHYEDKAFYNFTITNMEGEILNSPGLQRNPYR